MNCANCNWPYAPHELTADKQCLRCCEKARDSLAGMLAQAKGMLEEATAKLLAKQRALEEIAPYLELRHSIPETKYGRARRLVLAEIPKP